MLILSSRYAALCILLMVDKDICIVWFILNHLKDRFGTVRRNLYHLIIVRVIWKFCIFNGKLSIYIYKTVIMVLLQKVL